jgi:hypothetical protein
VKQETAASFSPVRLFVLALDAEQGPTHLTFLLNFFDELRRRAPASK